MICREATNSFYEYLDRNGEFINLLTVKKTNISCNDMFFAQTIWSPWQPITAVSLEIMSKTPAPNYSRVTSLNTLIITSCNYWPGFAAYCENRKSSVKTRRTWSPSRSQTFFTRFPNVTRYERNSSSLEVKTVGHRLAWKCSVKVSVSVHELMMHMLLQHLDQPFPVFSKKNGFKPNFPQKHPDAQLRWMDGL